METKFTSANGKWEIRTTAAPKEFAHADHWLRIVETTRHGYKDIMFRTMEEFWDDMPNRLDHGKNKDVPQSVVQVAAMIAQQLIEGGTK